MQAGSWIRWFVRCSNCICLCDDMNSKRTERYFSLREVVSNIADNKYVCVPAYALWSFSFSNAILIALNSTVISNIERKKNRLF